MTPSVARGTLEAARFFVLEAEKRLPSDITAFRYHLEAAIVFARSVTFHLQKEFDKEKGFAEWYEPHRIALAGDPLAKYFLQKRNYLLKEGRANLSHRLSVGVGAYLTISGSASVKVIRGRPWYRRSIRVLAEDALRPLRERAAQLRQSFEERRHERQRQPLLAQARSQPVTRFVGFVDSPLGDRQATDLLLGYLAQLERVVADAEVRFKARDRAV